MFIYIRLNNDKEACNEGAPNRGPSASLSRRGLNTRKARIILSIVKGPGSGTSTASTVIHIYIYIYIYIYMCTYILYIYTHIHTYTYNTYTYKTYTCNTSCTCTPASILNGYSNPASCYSKCVQLEQTKKSSRFEPVLSEPVLYIVPITH